MDVFLTFAGALAISVLASLAAAAQFADYFWYGEDFALLVVPVSGFALVAVLIFAVVYARAHSSRALAAVAIGLAIAAVLLAAAPVLVGYIAAQSKNPDLVLRGRDAQIRTALIIPMLLAVVTQWWFLRRRWLQARHLDHTTAWPWITTIAACVAALSPPGLAILGAAAAQSSTDWLRGLWLLVALALGGAVLLAGLIEWGIRARLRKRRLAPQGP